MLLLIILKLNGNVSREFLIIEDDLIAKSYGIKIAYFFEDMNCEFCVKFGRFLRSLFSPIFRIRIQDEYINIYHFSKFIKNFFFSNK